MLQFCFGRKQFCSFLGNKFFKLIFGNSERLIHASERPFNYGIIFRFTNQQAFQIRHQVGDELYPLDYKTHTTVWHT